MESSSDKTSEGDGEEGGEGEGRVNLVPERVFKQEEIRRLEEVSVEAEKAEDLVGKEGFILGLGGICKKSSRGAQIYSNNQKVKKTTSDYTNLDMISLNQ